MDSFVKISIVEDNDLLREGWKTLLEDEDDFIVVGVYSSCESALEKGDIKGSDIVLMDIELPGISGIEGVKRISKEYPSMMVIMATMHDDDESVFEAICEGAVGYLVKAITPDQLIRAIREVLEGGSPMTPKIARKMISSFQSQTISELEFHEELTEREINVLKGLADGKSYSVIGEDLFISLDGVRYHIRHIYEKLQVNSRGEAVAKGYESRLIHPSRK